MDPEDNTLDPDLSQAVQLTESDGNPNAISPVGAKGLYQVMDETGRGQMRKLGIEGEYKPFDPEQNTQIGEAELRDQLRGSGGDEALALAKYNHGSGNVAKLQAKYGGSYDDIAAHLPEETRNYVPKVLKLREELKKKDSNENETAKDYDQYPASGQGFSQALIPVLSDENFDNLTLSEKTAKLNEVFQAKKWGPQAYGTLKHVMSLYYDAASPDEIPDMKEIVGEDPPRVQAGEDPGVVLTKWKQKQLTKLFQAGISPALFGNALDNYLDSAVDNEKQANEFRQRGVLGEIASGTYAFGLNVAKGAGYGVTKPIAGITRLAGFENEANTIEESPEKLGKPVRDYIYDTDANGYLIPNKDGSFRTKWQTQAEQMVGQIGTFMAGGAALKAVGVGATAINTTMLGANTLTFANDSFRTVYEETGGDKEKAYKAAFFSLPAGALTTVGQVSVIGKLANPALKELGAFNKAIYLANVTARNAAIEGTANAAADAVAQTGETLQTGRAFDKQRLGIAAIGGAIPGAAFGAYHGITAEVQPKVEGRLNDIPAPTIQGPPEALHGPFPGLPEPQGLLTPERQKLLATNNPDQKSLSLHNIYAPATPEAQADITKSLQKFQQSKAAELVLSNEQAASIPSELFSVFQFTPLSNGQTTLVTKIEHYLQRDAGTVEGVDAHIANLKADLAKSPSPESVQPLIEERASVKKQLRVESQHLDERMTQLVKDRQEFTQAFDKAKSSYEEQSDPVLKKVAKLELKQAEGDLLAFDDLHSDVYQAHERIQPLQDRLDNLNNSLKEVLKPTYANDVKAKERNLEGLVRKRKQLADARKSENEAYDAQITTREAELARHQERAAAFQKLGVEAEPSLDFSHGVQVEGYNIVPVGENWYVTNKYGDIVGRPHDYYYDAVDSISNPEPRTAPRDRTSLSPAQEFDIEFNTRKQKYYDERLGQIKDAADTVARNENAKFVQKYRDKVSKQEEATQKKQAGKDITARKKELKKRGVVLEKGSSVTALDEATNLPEDSSVRRIQNRINEIDHALENPQSDFNKKLESRKESRLKAFREVDLKRANIDLPSGKKAYEFYGFKSAEDYADSNIEKNKAAIEEQVGKGSRRGLEREKKELQAMLKEEGYYGDEILHLGGDRAAPASETVERKPLEPSQSRSLTRRYVSPVAEGKVKGSNYSQLVQFPEDSTKLVRPQEITYQAQKLLDSIAKNLKIFQGGKVPKGVLGFLNYKRNYITTARHNDPVTVLHELTHAIDKALIGQWDANGQGDYSKVPPKVLEAAKDMADTYYNFQGDPSDNLKIQEGLATFFQHYATGQPYRQEIANWYHRDFALEHPQVYKAMEALKAKTFEYYNQTPLTYEQSRIVPRPNPTKERIKNYFTFNKLKDQWVDNKAVASDIDAVSGSDKSLKDLVDANHHRAKGVVDSLLKTGRANVNGKEYETLSFRDALAPAKGHEKELEAYMSAKNDIANYYNKGLDAGGNIEDATKVVAQIESQYPGVADAANNIWTKVLPKVYDIVSDSSREGAYYISKLKEENLNATGTEHGYYLPAPREGKKGYNPSAKRSGSTRAKVDPLGHLQEATDGMITKALQSQVKEQLVDLATGPHASSIGLFIHEVTGLEKRGLEEQYHNMVKEGLQQDPSREQKSLYSFFSEPLKGVSSPDFKVLSYMDGNKLRFFEIDPRVMKLFKDELPDFLNSAWFKYLFRPGAQILRPAATTLRAAFQVKNLIRDPQNAWVYINTGEGGFKDALSLGSAIVRNFVDVAHGGKMSKWVKESGLQYDNRAGVIETERANLQQKFGKNFLDMGSSTFNAIERFLSLPERVVRQASADVIMRKKLGVTDTSKLTPEQSLELMLAYKRSTTNFAVQGDASRIINLGVPFFTARINELTRIPGDVRRNAPRLAAYSAAMFTAGLWHALAHSDQDWYQEMVPDAKMNAAWFRWNIGGVEKAVMIPIGTEGAMPWGLGQAIGNKMSEDPKLPYDMKSLATSYFSMNFSPVNSARDFLTPWGKEYVQQESNKDFFTGRQIVPPSLQYQDPRLQYTEMTSELAKSVGNLTGISPLRLDHAIRATAPAAEDALQFMDRALGYKTAKDIQSTNFVINALTRAGTTAGIVDRSQNEFINKLLEARLNKPTETMEEGIIRKHLEKLNKSMSDINIVLSAELNQEERDHLRDTRKKLLKEGIAIAQGEGLEPSPSGVKEKAGELRKDKATQLKETLAKRKRALEEGILAGAPD